MERAYSGLRRKRKRAHSTKCPCCYSSEDEPENHTNLQKEKINEGTQIIGQRTRGRKSVQTSEEENEKREVRGVPCHPGEVIEAKKSGSAGAKKKTAREIKEGFGSKERKAARLRQENADTQQKDHKRQTTRGATTCNKKALRNSKTTQVEQAGQLNDDLEQRKASDVNKSNDTLGKSTKSRVKSRTKTSVDKKRTAREENNVSGLEKKDSEVKGKICRKQNSLGSKSVIISDNGIAMRLNQNQPGKNSIEARKKKVKTTQLTDSESGSPRKQKRVKANTEFSKNGKLQSTETISKKKVEVFDHLFAELKKCPGQSKASISMATELFLNFTSEKLKYLIQIPLSKTVKEDNQDLRQSVNTCMPLKTPVESKGKRVVSAAGLSSAQATDINDNCVSPPRRRGFRKSEETKLSQAAEALVSFRTNPSVLRQEKPEVDMQNTGVAENSIGKKIDNPLGSVQKVMCSTSQDVEAFMQVVSTACEAGLSQRNFSYSSPAAQNNLASKVSTSCLFQGAYLPQSLTSSGNLQQVTSCGSNIFTFGQLTSQMGAALTVQAHIQPEVTTSSSVSESSAVMSTGFIRNPADVQNLQALLCTTPQPSNFQIQSTLPPPVTAYAACQSTQPRPTLSQPLKGMEDVVSCVGSHSAALLWNVKPAAPVVYITSPQTLSGVRARNIVPNEGQGALPFGANPAKVSSLVVPNTSVNLQGADLSTLGKVTRMNQQGVPHSMSHTVSAPSQRPILPREQNSSVPTLPSSALQQPVTQGTSQIPGNSQPLGTGSMSLQSGILSVVSPLNRQPPTTYTTQMATLNTTHNAVSNTVTPVSAKQAVKRFVHERTKSAELKRTASVGNIPSTDTVDMPVTSSEKVVNLMCRLPVQSWTRQALNLNEQPDASETSEFNLQQAASALLSISSQDGLDAVEVLQPGGDGDDSLDEPDDEVVFTSKGVFRVGDVDVDPKYNRIGREGYSCGKCGKIFTSLSYLARHIKRVCPDMSCRKWKCTMCDKAFRHPFGLQQHIYTHTGERPHKCSQCPKAFYSSNDLRRHSRIHSGERPYHCKHCEKSFATTISLKTHTYIHTGEKPHKCPHCPKTFATSSKLGRHIVTHSEERPFSCKQCPKSFNRSGDLRRHNMHVHETRDKSFGWDDCSGPLETLDCLNVDMDNHDDRSDNLERGSEASLQSMLHGET